MACRPANALVGAHFRVVVNKPSWIELCYNQTRLHSAIGYRTPNEVHQDWGKPKTAA